MKSTLLRALACLLSITLNLQLLAGPLGTAFTYQGRLNDGSGPANGSYDLRFTLNDAATGLAQIGNALTNTAVPVSNGLFTVTLDFGTGVFTGGARWLEIGVRAGGSPADFTALAPRQPLTPSPYTLYAPSAGNAALLNGQSPATFAPATGSTAYVAKSGDTMTGRLNLPANGLWVGGTQLVASGGLVGIGKANPGTALDVNGTITATNFSGPGTGLTGIPTTGLIDNSVTSAKLASDSASLAKVAAGKMSVVGSVLAFGADGYLNDHDLFLRGDALHGLGWYGGGKLFAAVNVNGPVLYGNGGGALGARSATTNIALQWDGSRNVTIAGTLYASGPVQFGTNAFLNEKDLLFRSADLNHGLGWYGAGKTFAGVNLDGPALYGYSGGALGTFRGGATTNVAVRWDASGNVGIGTTTPGARLEVNGTVTANGLIRASGGLVIENRTSDPPSPVTGQIWLRTDL